MKVYMKLIIILDALVFCEAYTYQPNVGSVLFSPTDLHKNRWTQTELGSLRARRYFQSLLPPAKLTDSLNDEYLSYLLAYVQNCYNTVIDEAKTPTEHNVMANALSDVIGGYLKVWVLPITKYAFYGGTISSENAIKLFQMYDDIKRSLKTDGQSWHSQNEDLLQSVTINIAPNPHEWYTRSVHDTCDNLAYYEKTDKGLSIPLPYINWDLNPQTMFIPLKNQSLIQLNSLNSSNALLDYYNIASSCIHSLNMGSIDDFGSRFQIWLSSDVVPHLKDDNLYIAFGSVLTLLNKTKSFYKDMIKLCDNAYSKLQHKALLGGFPIHFTKKTIIIALIIFIELVWCIPVLYYLLCVKKPTKKKRNINQLFKYFKKDPHNKSGNKDPLHGLKLFVKPRTRNLELDVEFPTYGQKYYMKSTSTNVSRDNVYDNVTHINENIKRSSSKHNIIRLSDTKNASNSMRTDINVTNQHLCNCDSKKSSKNLSSFADNSTKTITLIEESEIKNLSYTHATVSVSKSMCKMSPDTVIKCSCTACVKNDVSSDPNQKPKKSLVCAKKNAIATMNVKNPVIMKITKPNKINTAEDKDKSKEHPAFNLKTIKPEITSKNRYDVTKIISKNKENKKSKPHTIDNSKIIVKENPEITQDLNAGNAKTKYLKKNLKTLVKRDDHGWNLPTIENKSNVNEIKKSKENENNVKHRISSLKRDNPENTTKNKSGHVEVTIETKSILNEIPKIIKEHSAFKKETMSDFKKPTTDKLAKSIKRSVTEKEKPAEAVTNVTIDSPRTDVDIKIFKPPVKSSKIPRRIFTTVAPAAIPDATGKELTSSKKEKASPRSLYRARKKTLDDSAIKKTVKKRTKLNTTL